MGTPPMALDWAIRSSRSTADHSSLGFCFSYFMAIGLMALR